MDSNEELKKAEREVMIERLLKAEEAAIASTLKAEEDIKAGRIYTADEFKKIIRDYIKQKR